MGSSSGDEKEEEVWVVSTQWCQSSTWKGGRKGERGITLTAGVLSLATGKMGFKGVRMLMESYF